MVRDVPDDVWAEVVNKYGHRTMLYAWGWWNGYRAATGKHPTEKQVGRILKRGLPKIKRR
jgi:hypothetical protein